MTDAEIDDMRRETAKIQAEASLIRARRDLADAKKSDLQLVLYPLLFGAGFVVLLGTILKFVLT